MWDVFSKAAIALDDAGVTDADELMKHGAATNEGIATEMDVASQHAAVGENVFVTHLNILGEMDADHEEVPFPESSGAANCAATVNGNVLANDVAWPHDNAALSRWLETQVLRVGADHGSTPDDALLTDHDSPDDLRMGLDAAACGDLYGSVDNDIGTDLDRGIDLG